MEGERNIAREMERDGKDTERHERSRGRQTERDGKGALCTLCGVNVSLLLSGFLFELHVPKVHDASGQLVHTHLLLQSEAKDIKGFLWRARMAMCTHADTERKKDGNNMNRTAVGAVVVLSCYPKKPLERHPVT